MFTEEEVLRLIPDLTRDELVEFVESGWLKPKEEGQAASGRFVFLKVDVARAQFITDLRHSMRVNDEAVPVILSLVEQVHTLRSDLDTLAKCIQTQGPDIRSKIEETIRQLNVKS